VVAEVVEEGRLVLLGDRLRRLNPRRFLFGFGAAPVGRAPLELSFADPDLLAELRDLRLVLGEGAVRVIGGAVDERL
jgi:hypothetical protein